MSKKIFISESFGDNNGGGIIVNRNKKIAQSAGYHILLFERKKGLLESISYHILGLPLGVALQILKKEYTHYWFDRSTYLITVLLRIQNSKSIIITYHQNNEFKYRKNIDQLEGDNLKKRIIRWIILIKEILQTSISDLSIFINRTEIQKPIEKQLFLPPTFELKSNYYKSQKKKIFVYYNKFIPNKIGFEKIFTTLGKLNLGIDIICRDIVPSENLQPNFEIKQNIENLDLYLRVDNILLAPIDDTNGFKLKVAEALVNGVTVITTKSLYDNLNAQGVPLENLIPYANNEELEKAILFAYNNNVSNNILSYKNYFSLENYKNTIDRIINI